MVFAFFGDLGTGKTVLVRGICAHFGCEEQVTSPTFTLINEYSGEIDIVHSDLYRLSDSREILETGLDEMMKQDRLVLIEWAEKALMLLPETRLEIIAAHSDQDDTRIYRWQYRTNAAQPSIIPPNGGRSAFH